MVCNPILKHFHCGQLHPHSQVSSQCCCYIDTDAWYKQTLKKEIFSVFSLSAFILPVNIILLHYYSKYQIIHVKSLKYHICSIINVLVERISGELLLYVVFAQLNPVQDLVQKHLSQVVLK